MSGVSVILPQCIQEYEYDFVVIFSNRYFRKIVRELSCEHFVPIEKIVSWRVIAESHICDFTEIRKYLIGHIQSFHNSSILEVGTNMLYGVISPANQILKDHVSVDGIGETRFPYEEAFYDHIWMNLTESVRQYDLAVIKPGLLTPSLARELFNRHIPRIVIIEEYNFEKLRSLNSILKILPPQKIKRVLLPTVVIVEIVEENDIDIDCTDYVITHKKYLINQDELYKGLSVGEHRIEGLLSEQDGESIYWYNDRINETTGLFWIWKNTNSDYVVNFLQNGKTVQ